MSNFACRPWSFPVPSVSPATLQLRRNRWPISRVHQSRGASTTATSDCVAINIKSWWYTNTSWSCAKSSNYPWSCADVQGVSSGNITPPPSSTRTPEPATYYYYMV
ncbi:hypothetical protein PR202_gb13525 [Eleusine coracana subsp. coracana]|uniref:Uncharacterized protein n=1 Tax=Eleusine coracana subsp. coracana TaxID=191504 RepID=A0AAV5ES95_ELECO|nr:hypothetical protein PR202_gb13525 [Eleusine coracana subsp. coracana]